jgi:ABC-type polysaccharide/polyol phosphate export permease
LTPVVYPYQSVPTDVQWVFWLNPFFIMMYPVQELVYMNEMPGFGATLALLILTLATVAVSYTVYRLCRRNYVYYL